MCAYSEGILDIVQCFYRGKSSTSLQKRLARGVSMKMSCSSLSIPSNSLFSKLAKEAAEEGGHTGGFEIVDRAFHDSGNDINEIKLKLAEMKAQIANLTEEKKTILHNTQQLQEQIASLRENSGRMVVEQKASGFSFLFILTVGVLGIIVGYIW
ncbi:hypothetical protein KP509_33G020400 [Ceratopteris richardii]|uniref:Uncharacterized protein n=1 Tax=Ceratopteris richardii TaxID=49495 RepID=A0A8T2QNS9_CERRI|nr:hypothetical protein KP509_33G020400 [Ceratopteris richardii]